MIKILSFLLLILTAVPAYAKEEQSVSLFTTGQSHFAKNEYSLAKADWQKAANQGDTQAMDKLADMYVNGTGVKIDYARAQKYWHQAADKGDGDAMYQIAMSYEFARDVPQDRKQWKIWFHKALDACGEDAAVRVIIMENSSPAETAKAADCLRKNAEKGNYIAMIYLSDRTGAAQPVLKDPLEALSWGHTAVDIMQKKADAGDTQAMYDMGRAFFTGIGAAIPQDQKRGLQLGEEAASQGNIDAMNWLISIYLSDDKYMDYKKVSFWNKKLIAQYNLLANKGNVDAMMKLADRYFRPLTGIGQDMGKPIEGSIKEPQKAVMWATKAAALGSREAWFLLGYIYEDTRDDNPVHDCKRARAAYDKGAALGDRNAIGRLSARAKGMPFLSCNF